jgi:hypothetical protein
MLMVNIKINQIWEIIINTPNNHIKMEDQIRTILNLTDREDHTNQKTT